MKRTPTQQTLLPTVVVIVGATGDLTRRKLVPALFHLFRAGVLPSRFSVVGFSRREFSDQAFRELVRSFLPHVRSGKKLKEFLLFFHYQQGQFDDPESYRALARHLQRIDDRWKLCTSTLFHLAVPPSLYQTIITRLAKSGLTKKCSDRAGWSRVLIEKPFGKDLATAQKLDARLGRLFMESQIFRVDHYLAKDTVQNILTFRFSNALFEPVWNREHIEQIDIKLLERVDVGSRGAFYDDTGALRDVGQNHMLQMLALIAMDHPEMVTPAAIRKARARVINRLRPLHFMNVARSVVRARYEGYTKEKDVSSESTTETYFKIRAQINSVRWRGVPFYLESGKALSVRKTEIVVRFKPAKPCFCSTVHGEHEHQNTIIFKIQPSEGIGMRIWAKQQDLAGDIGPRMLAFQYHDRAGRIIDAYEKLIYDAMRGDQTLFSSTEEVLASWRFITPILKLWKKTPLYTYAPGTRGPEESLKL